MTDNNELAAVPAHYPSPPPAPGYEPTVRVLPNSPVGNNGQLTATQMAELGAMLGALGAEKGASAAIIEFLQSVTMQVWIQQMPMLLSKLQGWEKARFKRLLVAVQTMPEAIPPPGLLNRIMGAQQVSQFSYVSREQVLRLITEAMSEAPAI